MVVGAGPTGLVAANLMASLGVEVLVVERNATTSSEAKAISLDEESLRSLQLAALDHLIYPIIVPGTGTRYYGRRGQPLLHARGGPAERYGHPFKNAFAQPELERTLRHGLERFPEVDVRFGVELVELQATAREAVATLQPTGGGSSERIAVSYVLGCDGGRSRVRELVRISMSGRSFDDVWLVVDTTGDPHDERYGMHHGEPGRPHVIVPGRDGRCRYEFLLRSGEGGPGEEPPFSLIQQLVAPYRDIAPEQVERATSYTFHALVADRFRAGRVFLLGDAAHMMPPFAGQGLNSGVRDATNLAWKIADVLADRADDNLLDTYESERRPHARATVDFSVRMGRIMMTTDRRRAALRDGVVGAAMRTRAGRSYLTGMRYRPSARFVEGAIVSGSDSTGLVGLPLVQPQVLRGRAHEPVRLDDVLGAGFALLGVDVTEADWTAVGAVGLPAVRAVEVVLRDRSARDDPNRVVVADADGRLTAALDGARGCFVLVRPDRVVAAVFSVSGAHDVVVALRARGIHSYAGKVRL